MVPTQSEMDSSPGAGVAIPKQCMELDHIIDCGMRSRKTDASRPRLWGVAGRTRGRSGPPIDRSQIRRESTGGRRASGVGCRVSGVRRNPHRLTERRPPSVACTASSARGGRRRERRPGRAGGPCRDGRVLGPRGEPGTTRGVTPDRGRARTQGRGDWLASR